METPSTHGSQSRTHGSGQHLLQNNKVNAKAKVAQEAAAVLDMSLEVQEELREAGPQWGLVGPRLPVPPTWLHPVLRFCFAGLLEKARCVLASELFFRKTKPSEQCLGAERMHDGYSHRYQKRSHVFKEVLPVKNQELLNLETKIPLVVNNRSSEELSEQRGRIAAEFAGRLWSPSDAPTAGHRGASC